MRWNLPPNFSTLGISLRLWISSASFCLSAPRHDHHFRPPPPISFTPFHSWTLSCLTDTLSDAATPPPPILLQRACTRSFVWDMYVCERRRDGDDFILSVMEDGKKESGERAEIKCGKLNRHLCLGRRRTYIVVNTAEHFWNPRRLLSSTFFLFFSEQVQSGPNFTQYHIGHVFGVCVFSRTSTCATKNKACLRSKWQMFRSRCLSLPISARKESERSRRDIFRAVVDRLLLRNSHTTFPKQTLLQHTAERKRG